MQIIYTLIGFLWICLLSGFVLAGVLMGRKP